MKNSVQSIERAFQILRVIHRHVDGVSVGKIADETGLHVSTASRIVGTLEQVGAIARSNGKLYVGDEIIELASQAPLTEQLIGIATPALRDLAALTKEAVGLTLIEGTDCHIFYQIPSSHLVQIRDWTGERFPLHTTSTGKVYLAQLADTELATWRDVTLEKVASGTKLDWAEIEAEFALIRREGVAWTIDELEDGLTSIASAICNEVGDFVAGLYVSIPSYRLGDRDVLAARVRNAAAEISMQMG